MTRGGGVERGWDSYLSVTVQNVFLFVFRELSICPQTITFSKCLFSAVAALSIAGMYHHVLFVFALMFCISLCYFPT